ncbi:MAG: polysaccharide deacetylase family protein [Dethiobacteria bacterium]|nr:polysaccharide deacetylase family protein [Dethiobacteria bacterium]
MEEIYSGRTKQPRNKAATRLVIFIVLLAITVTSAFYGLQQSFAVKGLQSDLAKFEERLTLLEEENRTLRELYDQISEENESLLEINESLLNENKMLRSSIIKNHGSRDTNLVAITIDDGAGPELIGKTLDHLKEHNVRATFFPMGSWVAYSPDIWKRAVEEGHELGNHTYSHAFLTTISEDRIRDELNRWQEAVDEALGHPYKTLFFRPPGMDGFTSAGSSRTKRYQEIIADKGMFAVLWDVELVYALRNEAYTSARVAEHVLANARGGSIVLLHFTPTDIAALPEILSGLRRRGLEPCSLSELLLTEPRT